MSSNTKWPNSKLSKMASALFFGDRIMGEGMFRAPLSLYNNQSLKEIAETSFEKRNQVGKFLHIALEHYYDSEEAQLKVAKFWENEHSPA